MTTEIKQIKEKLIDSLVDEIGKSIEQLQISLESARQAAIQAPGKMESRYDTAKSEHSSLADGIMGQILEQNRLLRSLNDFKLSIHNEKSSNTVRGGSLVMLETKQGKETLFIIPGGSGYTVNIEGEKITLISPQTPMAKILFSHQAGEEAKLQIGQETRVLKILRVE